MLYGLFVGINYPGTINALAGCVNDAKDLANKFGPKCADYIILLDRDATKENVLNHLRNLISRLKRGDTLLFTFSGHGTWKADTNGDEPDRRDECLCPIDLNRNLIVDDELEKIFNEKKWGTKVVFLSDTCHSGTVFRAVDMSVEPDGVCDTEVTRKFIPPEEVLEGRDFARTETLSRSPTRPRSGAGGNAPRSGLIHISGCKDDEYSYDAYFGGRPNGAFTKTFLDVYNEDMTYKELHEAIADRLPSDSYPQSPRLNATSTDRRRKVV